MALWTKTEAMWRLETETKRTVRLLLALDLGDVNLVDFGCQDEIVLVEAANGVRPGVHNDIVPLHQMEVRMVAFLLRNGGDELEKLNASNKVLDLPLPPQSQRAIHVDDLPPRDLLLQTPGLTC